ncbi:MAG: hypothetical protein JWN29_3340 [Acidimicrobiales bacterium]|nr:hypothetical protein [Acidimicrobiales bacterium]
MSNTFVMIRGLVRRLAVAGALASFLLFFAEPYVGAQEAPALPESFGGAASASALEIALVTPSLVPVEDLFDVHVAEGRGTYESDNQEGRASLLLGGNALVLGPSLLCEAFIGPQMSPEGKAFLGPVLDACSNYRYPLAVFVDPLNPDGQTEGAGAVGKDGDPFAVRAVGARAHAGIDATTTDAELSDVRLLGAPAVGSLAGLLEAVVGEAPDASLLRVDGVTAHTDQRFKGDTLVLDARATISGLRLLGGIVRIGSIDSHARLELTPGREPKATTTLDIGGVEVAGNPATIGEKGLVLGTGGSGPLQDQVNRQVADLLGESGLKVTVLPSAGGDDETPGASIGGVEIELVAPITGLPPVPGPTGESDLNGDYGVRLRIGATGVRGFADDLPDLPPLADVGMGIGIGGDPSLGTTPGTDVAPVGTSDVGSPRPAAEAGADRPVLRAALSDLVVDRLRLLYLAFTLVGIALCLTPRFTLPARFPAARG